MSSSALIHATVWAGFRPTRYAAMGSGRPVVVLGDGGAGGAPRQHLVTALASQFRVYVPETVSAEAAADLSTWLAGFLDGLGLQRPGLVAIGCPGAAVLGHAIACPWQIGCLALLVGERGALCGVSGVTDHLVAADLPLLVTSIGAALNTTVLSSFLIPVSPGR